MRWSIISILSLLLLLPSCGGGGNGGPAPIPKVTAPTAIAGQPYFYVIQGYTSCTLTSGSLPTGLALSGCVISGIPAMTGTSTFTVAVQ